MAAAVDKLLALNNELNLSYPPGAALDIVLQLQSTGLRLNGLFEGSQGLDDAKVGVATINKSPE